MKEAMMGRGARKLRMRWMGAVLLGLLPSVSGAAPTVSPAIDVAPRNFVPSNHTSEPVLGVAAGAGRVAVLSQNSGLTLLKEDLSIVGEPLGYAVDASSLAFDGVDFLLASYAKQPPAGGQTYLAALEIQRLAPTGTLKDVAPVLGDVQVSGTFDSTVAIACKAPGDCLAAYSMRKYGTGGESDQDIWVAPVKNGVPGASIQVTTAAEDQFSPSVVWDGTSWVVAWVDLRFATGSGAQYKNTQLYGARVSTTGAVLDPVGIPLATYAELADTTNTSHATALPEAIALARSGSTTLLAWRGSSSNKILGRRLAANLSALDATPIVMATKGSSWINAPRLLSASDGFTLLFGESAASVNVTNIDLLALGFDGHPKGASVNAGSRFAYGLYAARLSDGSLALGKTVPGPKNSSAGKAYTDTWVERVSSTAGSEIASAYVSKALTVVMGRALAQAPQLGVVVYADNRNGDNYKYTNIDIYAAVLTASGGVVPSAGVKLSTPPKGAVAAAAGSNRALVVWEEGTTVPRDVIGVMLDGAGNVVKSLVFGGQAYDEASPAVSFDGQNFVVSWTDRGNGYDAGVFRRVAPSGVFVDPAFVFVAPGTTSTTTIEALSCNESGSCLARSGNSYYLLQNGAVALQKAAWEVGIKGFDAAAIAGGGSGFGLMTKGPSFEDVALIRLGGLLTVQDSAAVPLFDANNVSNLVPKAKAVAWNGGRFVTAWQNGKGVSLASLPEAGAASAPYLLDTQTATAGYYDTAAKNLLLSGANDRTVVGYQDEGRILVSGITGLETVAGTGGSSGSGGSGGSGGTGGTAGAGGSGGAGAGGSGGSGGVGGGAGTGGSSGFGGAATGGSSGFGGAGTGGGSGFGGAATGGAAGTGGASTGGAAGTGGSNNGAAAGWGFGGASAGAAGAPMAGGSSDGAGCACSAGQRRSQSPVWATAVLLALGLGAGRRRRAPYPPRRFVCDRA